MLKRVVVFVLCIVVGSAVGLACREVGTAPVAPGAAQLSQAGAIDRPFAGTCDVSLKEELAGGQVRITGQGKCELTHLGRSNYRVDQIADATAGLVSGTATFTAANGDELRASIVAPLTAGSGLGGFQGTVTFAGGTGRFRNATGTASFARGPGQKNGPGAPGIGDRYDGILRFDPSGKDPVGEGPVSFALDASNAVTRTVDIEGAALTARSASGIDYELVIPRGALNEPLTITMTPIASAQNFPTSGGFAAGVDFAPAGLRFAQAARLRITLPTRPAGFQLIVTGYDADPAALLPLLPADDGTVIEVPVAHFSGVAAGFGTSADLLAMPIPGPTTQSSHYIGQLAAVPVSGLTDAEKLTANTQILVLWLTGVVQPLFAAATTDLQLLLAMSEFDLWNGHAQTLGLTAALAADIADTKAMAALDLLAAIDGNADRCGAQQSLAALYNVGFWYLQALYIDVAQPTHFLDANSVDQSISSRCLTVELESETLPTPMIVGTPYTVSLVWGIRFKGQTTLQGVPLHVGLAPLGPVTIAPGAGASDIAGLFQTVITANAAGAVHFVAAACLPLPGLAQPPPPYGCQLSPLSVGAAVVLDRPAVDGIQVAVTPASATLAAGATTQFTAQVTGTSNQNVNWTATGGTISSTGLFTAGNVAGTFSVTATSVTNPSAFDVAPVTISSSAGLLEWHFDTDLEGWSCNSTSSCKWQLLTSNQNPETSGWVALQSIGSAVSRTIAIPPDARFLRFGAATHNVPGDVSRVQVQVGGVTVLDSTFVNPGSNTAFNFVPMTIDISARAGQTVNIRFVQLDDGAGTGTTLKIDDIRIEAN
jgi:hypothetical protein